VNESEIESVGMALEGAVNPWCNECVWQAQIELHCHVVDREVDAAATVALASDALVA